MKATEMTVEYNGVNKTTRSPYRKVAAITSGIFGMFLFVALAVERFLPNDSKISITLSAIEEMISSAELAEPVDISLKNTRSNMRMDEEYFRKIIDQYNYESPKKLTYISINESVREDSINIYFVTNLLDGSLFSSGLKNNCGYIGYKNIIICDGNFTRALQDQNRKFDKANVQLSEKPTQEEIRAFVQNFQLATDQLIVFWLIAHEVGHIVYEQTNVIKNTLTPLFQSVRAEREAFCDDFAFRTFANDDSGFQFFQALERFVRKSIADMVDPDDLSEAIRATEASDGAHESAVVRALHGVELIDEKYHFESPGFVHGLAEQLFAKNRE